jgi:hypothetical protein
VHPLELAIPFVKGFVNQIVCFLVGRLAIGLMLGGQLEKARDKFVPVRQAEHFVGRVVACGDAAVLGPKGSRQRHGVYHGLGTILRLQHLVDDRLLGADVAGIADHDAFIIVLGTYQRDFAGDNFAFDGLVYPFEAVIPFFEGVHDHAF